MARTSEGSDGGGGGEDADAEEERVAERARSAERDEAAREGGGDEDEDHVEQERRAENRAGSRGCWTLVPFSNLHWDVRGPWDGVGAAIKRKCMTASGEIVNPREVAEHLRNTVCKPKWLAAHAYATINEMVVLYIDGEREVAWMGTSTCTESSS
ncbi:hypothetical protein T492DRAFT_1135618 [Pavlovales sp. CCMP2436]|nr:hypothetical protein T492DRAFT_1135618 [Pavlovales sp. CCMP2436]